MTKPKSASSAARAAGSNVGNAEPGAGEQGQNATRRDAQAGGESVSTETAARASSRTKGKSAETGLSVEQQDMERQRAEYGSQQRGTGDMPPAVHGRTRHVVTQNDSVAREFSEVPTRRDRKDRVLDPELVPKTRKVRALKLGYYDDKRRRPGDVFLIRAPYTGRHPDTGDDLEIDEFSDNWMEEADADEPERITTGKQALKAQHDEEMAARRHGPRTGASGSDSVIGDD